MLPFEAKTKKTLEKLKNKYKIYIHSHPGYHLNDAHTNKYLIDFAKKINQSKIVVSCSSKYKYRLGKYIEVPACNTVLAADLPIDNEADYNHFIKLSMDMSNKEIEDKLIEHLTNNDKYEEKRIKGLEFAKKYTQEKYAQKLLKKIKEYLF